MANNSFFDAWRCASLCLLICIPLSAYSECSRVIKVPISPIGLSVVVSGETVAGVYPNVLRSMASKEGCTFEFSVVSRARLEAMFKVGNVDLFIPATRSPLRDERGLFVPLIYSRATVISIASDRAPIRTAQDLLDRRELKVAVVRGFDFGPAYQKLVNELSSQGRVSQVVDAASVGRMMDAGMADVTIMAPSILFGAIKTEGRIQGLLDKLRYEQIDELAWGDSGAYISNTSLNEADRAALRDLLERAAKSGVVWKAFQHYYPPNALEDSIRPR